MKSPITFKSSGLPRVNTDMSSESSAGSVEAKKKGLISAGFGRYRSKEGGPITHKLEEGKLVRVAQKGDRMNPTPILDAVEKVCNRNRVHSKRNGTNMEIEFGSAKIEVKVGSHDIKVTKTSPKGEVSKTYTSGTKVAGALASMFKAAAARGVARAKKKAAAK